MRGAFASSSESTSRASSWPTWRMILQRGAAPFLPTLFLCAWEHFNMQVCACAHICRVCMRECFLALALALASILASHPTEGSSTKKEAKQYMIFPPPRPHRWHAAAFPEKSFIGAQSLKTRRATARLQSGGSQRALEMALESPWVFLLQTQQQQQTTKKEHTKSPFEDPTQTSTVERTPSSKKIAGDPSACQDFSFFSESSVASCELRNSVATSEAL